MNEKIHGRRLMIILICMASQAIPFTIAQSIQPLFVPYVVKTFDFSLASYSLIFTFGAVSSAIISPMVGKILPKINFRVIYLTGIILNFQKVLQTALLMLPDSLVLCIQKMNCHQLLKSTSRHLSKYELKKDESL